MLCLNLNAVWRVVYNIFKVTMNVFKAVLLIILTKTLYEHFTYLFIDILWVACVFQGTFWINVIIHNYLWIIVMAFCSIVIMVADYKVECDYMDRTNPYGKIIGTSHNLVWLAYHANRAFARWSQELGAKKQLFACLDYMLSARISIWCWKFENYRM